MNSNILDICNVDLICLGDFSFNIYINDTDQSDSTFYRAHGCFTNILESVIDQALWSVYTF